MTFAHLSTLMKRFGSPSISNTYLPGPEYKYMKNNEIMSSTAGGIIRVAVCASVKPTQRRFVASDRQTRLSWYMGVKERKGERAYHASLKEGLWQTCCWWGRPGNRSR